MLIKGHENQLKYPPPLLTNQTRGFEQSHVITQLTIALFLLHTYFLGVKLNSWENSGSFFNPTQPQQPFSLSQ